MTIINLPRFPLAHLPTALEPLPRLSAALGGPQLWIKRDDLTGLAFGGNKTRKLEYLLAEAQAHGARMLITMGAPQSNHCRQTAAAAARAGLACTLVLRGSAPARLSGNLLLDQLLGAELVWSGEQDMGAVGEQVFQDAWNAGKRPYLIPYGGSNPLGAAAYAAALGELLQQKPDFDRILFASSSGGTQAGLLLGAKMYGFEGEILGISVDSKVASLRDSVLKLAQQTADLIGFRHRFNANEVLINDEFLGGGYAIVGDLEKGALQQFARHEGILLDPVYSGRAAGGMLELIARGEFKRSEKILFWHTGGTPAIFAFEEQLS